MKTPPKAFWYTLIALVLIIVVVLIVLPEKETTQSDANLVFFNDSDTPVGSVYISYARWDGSGVTEGGMNADSSLLERGDDLQFGGVMWPVTVTVCSDLQGRKVLAQIIVEEAPAEGLLWRVVLLDSADGLRLVLEDAPRG